MGILNKMWIIALLVLVGCSSGQKQESQNKNETQENKKDTLPTVSNDSVYFVYPKGGEVFIIGKTYNLIWKGKTDTAAALFLIDSSLESKGVSVSISDRVYDIPQSGSEEYRFPQRLKPGTYKFQLGRAESQYFQVKAKE
ncbi:MAG TPA: hypothetical protein VK084_05540 [Chitinophagaceae bacterium]|nr:hypothetical protein [Chitinophagaceae bacterium]